MRLRSLFCLYVTLFLFCLSLTSCFSPDDEDKGDKDTTHVDTTDTTDTLIKVMTLPDKYRATPHGENLLLSTFSRDESSNDEKNLFTTVLYTYGGNKLWERSFLVKSSFTPQVFSIGENLYFETILHKIVDTIVDTVDTVDTTFIHGYINTLYKVDSEGQILWSKESEEEQNLSVHLFSKDKIIRAYPTGFQTLNMEGEATSEVVSLPLEKIEFNTPLLSDDEGVVAQTISLDSEVGTDLLKYSYSGKILWKKDLINISIATAPFKVTENKYLFYGNNQEKLLVQSADIQSGSFVDFTNNSSIINGRVTAVSSLDADNFHFWGISSSEVFAITADNKTSTIKSKLYMSNSDKTMTAVRNVTKKDSLFIVTANYVPENSQGQATVLFRVSENGISPLDTLPLETMKFSRSLTYNDMKTFREYLDEKTRNLQK